MRLRRFLLPLLAASFLAAQNSPSVPVTQAPSTAPAASAPGPLDYVCPMDPDVRSDTPGKCPRCGMTLILGIPEEREYRLGLNLEPEVVRPTMPVNMTFRVQDPSTGAPVSKFIVMHEKLFHMFIVSQDLAYFVHEHPVPQPDGSFIYQERFPKPGMYRILGDFYPEGGTPQLIARTVIVPGGSNPPVLQQASLQPDLTPKQAENMSVDLVTEPAQPIAGMKTLMFFHVKPAQGLEKYIGAWAHMLAVSDDLVDMIHTHPFIADGGPQLQFNMIFPRARTYRVWVQFQRLGVVNTVAFDVPVKDLE